MTPMRLASIFTVLDTYGVQDVLRVQSTVNPLDPDNHTTAVWVRPSDWVNVYDAIFYATDEVPEVRASMATTGVDITVALEGDGFRVFAWWPVRDLESVSERLAASGVEERKVQAWRLLGGAA
jgi:hypothetical protein